MIELGDIDTGGGPIWCQSDGADSARETVVVVTTFVFIALALLLSLVLPIKEKPHMPKSPFKTAETPENELPFPGRLVEGKYDVQYLHLWVCTFLRSSSASLTSTGPSPFHRKQNRKTLVAWCREFRLPISGTVPALTARLIDFSADREMWEDR